MSSLLESFQEAYRNLELLPLITEKELNALRVEYGRDTIEELEQLVEDSPSRNSKIIFSGHRGCGKSTLLAEFSRKLKPRYFVVFFSISDLIEMSDVNHINILFAIAVKLMEEAEAEQVKIKESIKNQFYQWFKKQTKIEIEEVSAELSGGFNLFEWIKGRLKADAKVRMEIKEEFARKISELVARINEIAAVIYQGTNREILVIIDDLDKLDLAVVREVYHAHIKALFQPNFHIVFTIPISVLRDVNLKAVLITETNDQIVTLPVAKLFDRGTSHQENARPNAQPTATLQEIIDRRIAAELFASDVKEQLIVYSGGVLRELIRLSNECCRICLRLIRRNPSDRDIKIDKDILEQAIVKLRIDFSVPIGKADYEILKQTYTNFQPDDPQEQRFLDLLHGLYVLEYKNSVLWYDVHPLVVGLLEQRGVI
ncbi:MAG: ATP-binding protein [Cyanobacteria bacterium SBLK]|nr:ATP-binding protein [Cyanobacteria bacterium SBLK]